MTIINAEKFLGYLIVSKHIDGLTCGEVKEAVEMCKVDGMSDVLDKIRAEIEYAYEDLDGYDPDALPTYISRVLQIIDKYRKEQTDV